MRRGGGYDDQGRPYRLDMAGPCSPNQWGRIRREWERLGLDDLDGAHADERLRLTGALAGRPVASTRDLDAATAGRVIRVLAGCPDLFAVEAVIDAPRRERRRARQWAKVRAQLAAFVEAGAA